MVLRASRPRSPHRSTTGSRALVVAAALLASLTVGLRIQAAIEERTPLPGGGVEDPCTLWFIGSSTIHKWTSLDRDFRPWRVRNRGVNGAPLIEIDRRLRHEPGGEHPAAIVFYGGDNDIAEGRSPERALDDLAKVIAAKRAVVGATPMIVLGLKPSPTRWNVRADQRAYDSGAKRLAKGGSDLAFAAVGDRFLVDGRPGPYYVADGVHLDAAGYRIMTMAVTEALMRTLPPAVTQRCLGERRD